MSVPYDTRSNWSWPKENVDSQSEEGLTPTRTFAENVKLEEDPSVFADEFSSVKEEHSSSDNEENTPPPTPPPQKRYATRTCRICLEEVFPSIELNTSNIPSLLAPAPKVSYISAEASSGRLIRPCKCRGSQKYVHEGCLREWRHSDPTMARPNFWECPTCKYRYRLERMRWRGVITSTATQMLITFGIMFATVFFFGFVADPIINLYLDPYETITSLPANGKALLIEDEDASWAEHFLKGLASLGLLGFVKVFFAMSPWHWWNLRNGIFGGGGGRRRAGAGTGRDRLADISWTVVIIGVFTFLAAVWTWVRAWTRTTLEKAGERVVDVQGDDEAEELEDPLPAQAAAAAQARAEAPGPTDAGGIKTE